MTHRTKTLSSALATLIALAALTGTAHAQFAPSVTSDEIEGAIMPAIPFPKGEQFAVEPMDPAALSSGNATQAPASMGLSPSNSEDSGDPFAAARNKRKSFTASEIAERYLR